MAHVVLKTRQFDAVRQWYQTVLCARLVFANDTIAFLSYDDEHHRLAIIRLTDSGELPVTGLTNVDHIAFSFGDLGSLLGCYRRLRDAGIAPVRTINHGPTISFYYVDPDGLRVEMQVDNYPSSEAVTAFFHSPDFAANPIGVHFDPEQLICDYEAGLPLDVLAQRPALPPGRTSDDMRRDNAAFAPEPAIYASSSYRMGRNVGSN